MSKIVQLSRGDRESQDRYVGAAGELTVDTSNEDLRLHDGVTPGGVTIANRANNDSRYQPRSVELNGLLGFEPQDRGFLARRGPSDYRLRRVEVNGAQLVVTNPEGYAGNPAFSLAPAITSNHTFSGVITFSQTIIATGGINGSLVGSVTGNVEGNLLGNVVGNLSGNAAGDHTGTFTGDVDTRGKTLKLGAGQIPLDSLAADVLAFVRSEGAPRGLIACWYGNVNAPPAGWFLCDGSNGTPDLRNRFVVGAGQTYGPGNNGGSATHTHDVTVAAGGSHVHDITVADTVLTVAQMPSHNHGNGQNNDNSGGQQPYGSIASPGGGGSKNNADNTPKQGLTTTVGGNQPHGHAGSSAAGGIHTHVATADPTAVLPPYYALAYIMRGL